MCCLQGGGETQRRLCEAWAVAPDTAAREAAIARFGPGTDSFRSDHSASLCGLEVAVSALVPMGGAREPVASAVLAAAATLGDLPRPPGPSGEPPSGGVVSGLGFRVGELVGRAAGRPAL